MQVSQFHLPVFSGHPGAVPFLLVGLAISWFTSPQSLDLRLMLTRPKPRLKTPGWWHVLSGSLALWGLACGAAVIALHNATSDAGPRLGAYRTGMATLVLFAVAASVAMRHRIARALPHSLLHGASQYRLQPSAPPHNVSFSPSASRYTFKPKTWQRMHIALAIGAMLPLWWHCDLGRASTADQLLKRGAILLIMSGFCGVATTDLSRWRLLSPKFSPRLSARLNKVLFIVHRGLALLTFMLITIHVLVVLYFAGL
jgi:hypothetical protein